MIFSEDFFEKLPDELTQAIKQICDTFFDYFQYVDESHENYADYLDAFAALEAFILAHKLDNEFDIPEISEDRGKNKIRINSFYTNVNSKISKLIEADQLESARFKYKAQLGSIFSYKFSDGDLSRIQELINELRDLINRSGIFESNHKERLLTKLENLQKELHKRVSNLDKFWGLIGDAGIALGKFGNDAKPFVDRMKEIAEIVWRTQASAEELPSGTSMPMLNKENS